MLHNVGCASRPGSNATVRHNKLRDYIHHLLEGSQCVFVEKEPRDFENHVCRTCGAIVSRSQAPSHSDRCRGKLDRHGPDLRVSWSGSDGGMPGDIFYDITVVHVTAPSYNSAGSTAESLLLERKKTKIDYYTRNNLTEDQSLIVLNVRALGGLCGETLELLRRAAIAARRDVDEVVAEFGFLLQTANGELSRPVTRMNKSNTNRNKKSLIKSFHLDSFVLDSVVLSPSFRADDSGGPTLCPGQFETHDDPTMADSSAPLEVSGPIGPPGTGHQ